MNNFFEIPVINPSSYLKLIWDILIVLIITIILYFIPINLIYNISFEDLIEKKVNFIIPLILLCDLLINLNTGFYKEGKIVEKRV